MSHQDGLGDNGPEATGLSKPDDGDDRMEKESENVAHARDGTKLKNLKNSGRLRNSPTTGGFQARWQRDGKEILYFTAENRLMSVDVATTPTFKPGIPKPLFVAPLRGGANNTTPVARWDISPDGQRFLINAANEDSLFPPITVLLNWTSAFRK